MSNKFKRIVLFLIILVPFVHNDYFLALDKIEIKRVSAKG